MKLDKSIVSKLLGILGNGLCHGAGNMNQTFCVQQAVSQATGERKREDHPLCVGSDIIELGICLNDNSHWESPESRAKGLVRFAVAELGSNELNQGEFMSVLKNRIQKLEWARDKGNPRHCVQYATREEHLVQFANIAADVLKDMGSPGAKYLPILGDPEKAKDIKFSTWASRLLKFEPVSCPSHTVTH